MTPAERQAEHDPRQRFRPYRLRRSGASVWIAAAGCETLDGIGLMLQKLRDDGEYDARDQVGILDTAAWAEGEPGAWLISPYGDAR